jgi:hypothetical protein
MASMSVSGLRSKKHNRGRGKSVINQALVELMSRATLAGVAEHDVCNVDSRRQSFGLGLKSFFLCPSAVFLWDSLKKKGKNRTREIKSRVLANLTTKKSMFSSPRKFPRLLLQDSAPSEAAPDDFDDIDAMLRSVAEQLPDVDITTPQVCMLSSLFIGHPEYSSLGRFFTVVWIDVGDRAVLQHILCQ